MRQVGAGGHGGRQGTGQHDADDPGRKIQYLHHQLQQHLVGFGQRRIGKSQYAGKADKQQRHQQIGEQRVEHAHLAQGIGAVGRVELHEQVRPHGAAEGAHQDSGTEGAPAHDAGGAGHHQVFRHLQMDLLEHGADAAKQAVGHRPAKEPGDAHHHDPLHQVGPADTAQATAVDVNGHHQEGNQRAQPERYQATGRGLEQQAGTGNLNGQIGNKGHHADDTGEGAQALAVVMVGNHVGLGQIAVLFAQLAHSRTHDPDDNGHQAEVSQNIESRRPILVGPAGRTEKGKGRKDFRPQDKKQDHHAHVAATGHIFFQTGTGVLGTGPQPDPQHQRQIGQGDPGHDNRIRHHACLHAP